MHDAAAAVGWLEELSALGVQLAIDDFGTGYSSLSYLRQFPVNTLKIDKSFVDDIARDSDRATLVSAIIELGRSLGLKTVAEGIEQVEQLAELTALGCDVGQGYHFARPLDRDGFESTLASAAADAAKTSRWCAFAAGAGHAARRDAWTRARAFSMTYLTSLAQARTPRLELDLVAGGCQPRTTPGGLCGPWPKALLRGQSQQRSARAGNRARRWMRIRRCLHLGGPRIARPRGRRLGHHLQRDGQDPEPHRGSVCVRRRSVCFRQSNRARQTGPTRPGLTRHGAHRSPARGQRLATGGQVRRASRRGGAPARVRAITRTAPIRRHLPRWLAVPSTRDLARSHRVVRAGLARCTRPGHSTPHGQPGRRTPGPIHRAGASRQAHR